MKTLIFGHKNPDTDTICSAMALSLFLGDKTQAVRLGKLNKETEFVLNYIGEGAPELLENVEDNQDVILVDHNEFGQSINNIEKANILAVYDHHRIANFKCVNPITIDIRPVGCTATVLYDKFKDNITKTMAHLMLSAIISDTLLFKSPTCTDRDIEVAKILEKIAELNLNTYGMEMLEAGSSLDSYKTIELLDIDTKEFKTDNGYYSVGQINTVDLEKTLLMRETELLIEMKKRVDDKNFDAFLFVITDILNSNSEVILVGEHSELIASKFKKELKNSKITLDGVVSRKKQIVPNL